MKNFTPQQALVEAQRAHERQVLRRFQESQREQFALEEKTKQQRKQREQILLRLIHQILGVPQHQFVLHETSGYGAQIPLLLDREGWPIVSLEGITLSLRYPGELPQPYLLTTKKDCQRPILVAWKRCARCSRRPERELEWRAYMKEPKCWIERTPLLNEIRTLAHLGAYQADAPRIFCDVCYDRQRALETAAQQSKPFWSRWLP